MLNEQADEEIIKREATSFFIDIAQSILSVTEPLLLRIMRYDFVLVEQ